MDGIMDVGLREYKQSSLRVAIPTGLPEHMQPHMRELLSIQSGNPRKGHATGLMYQVCQEADDACKTLIIHVEPFDEGMTQEQLKKWYEKFGFVEIQTDPVLMMARQVQRNLILKRA